MSTFGLSADSELRSILFNYASETVTRNPPDCIFRQGQKSHGFYVVNNGCVRLSMETPTGLRAVDRVVGPGCLVGLPATASGRAYSLTCEVIESAELSYISRRDYSSLMKCESEAAMKLLGILSREIQSARLEIAHSPGASSAAISIVTH